MMDEQIVSDLYKEVYGSRPRDAFWAQWDNSTKEEKQNIWDHLCREFENA